MRKLLDDEKAVRRRVLRQLDLKVADLRHAYDTLHWCDRCSLILCGDEVPAMNRKLEIITTDAGVSYDIFCNDGLIGVDPWPFVNSEFSVGVDVYNLTQLEFADDAELNSALDECVPEYRTWQFKK